MDHQGGRLIGHDSTSYVHKLIWDSGPDGAEIRPRKGRFCLSETAVFFPVGVLKSRKDRHSSSTYLNADPRHIDVEMLMLMFS
jgi:hypothetical protein